MVRRTSKTAFWLIVIVALIFAGIKAFAQPQASEDVVWWLCRELDTMKETLTSMQRTIGDLREMVGRLNGWLIGIGLGAPVVGGGAIAIKKIRSNGGE